MENADSKPGLSLEQQEIIDLLCGELEDIHHTDLSGFKSDSWDNQKELLGEFELRLSHIGKALHLAGLEGLAEYIEQLNVNFSALQQTDQPLGESTAGLVCAWPQLILSYLQDIQSGTDASVSSVPALLELITQPGWPSPVTGDARSALETRFNESNILIDDDEVAFPSVATDEMVSLELGTDARPELMNDMLIELPEQVRQFEESVNNYLGSGSITQLAQAQRMAHTLKGAGNVVGVPGIANLMHYTEDLLEMAAKRPDALPEGFDELLENASDCLASMAEFLCHSGEAPDNAVEVLQQILDFDKLIRAGAPATSGGTISPEEVLDTEPEELDTAELHEKLHENLHEKLHTDELHKEELHTEELDVELLQNEMDELQQQLDPEIPIDDIDAELASLNADAETEEDTALFDSNFDELESLLEDINESDIFGGVTTVEEPTAEYDTAAEISATTNDVEQTGIAVEHAAAPVDASAQLEQDEEKYHLNLPGSTAQELLRIAGETQITNSQVMAQIEAMQASIQLTERYHKMIRNMSVEMEALVQTQSALRATSMKYSDDEMDPLEMERFNELHTFSQQLLELTTDSYEAVSHIENQIRELSTIAHAQKLLNQDNQALLLQLRLVPVKTMSSRFSRCVKQACRLTGKSARLEIQGEDLFIDSRVLNRIVDPLMHLLRNAVDHGLERDVSERTRNGKSAEGKIVLSFNHSGETITIQCRDDGNGLDYEHIRNVAVAKGFIASEENINESTLTQYILMPGFSTRDKVSQTSGRGIGLDAVQTEVRNLKGTMSITSTAGEGTCFSITVPTSILTGHALLVYCSGREGHQVLSIVTRNIEQIIYVQPEQLTHKDESIVFMHNDDEIPVYDIADLTNMYSAQNKRTSAILVVQKSDGERVGVAVESITASQDLVIKPLNQFSHHPPGVVGATILGDGTVSPVIDIQELPGMNISQDEMARLRSHRAKIAALEHDSRLDPPVALIVDDSLSARRSLAQFVADMGMEVYTAKDGFEAINVLSQKKPSLMLVDLEMPRMNGLELTAHIRSREDTRDIPVIMITSRTTEKHKSMAQSAGVSSYLNKPWSDEELLSTIQQQIAS